MTLRELIKKAEEEGIDFDAPLAISHDEYGSPEDSCPFTVWQEIEYIRTLHCGAVFLEGSTVSSEPWSEPELKDFRSGKNGTRAKAS